MMSLVKEIRKKWKPRKLASHKGDYGRIFILAGSRGLAGAAHLAGMGALRAGAGLVTVGVPGKIYSLVARREAELMVRPFPSTAKGSLAQRGLKEILHFSKSQDVLALGPGLSTFFETQKVIRDIVAKTKNPLVVDADGLNAFRGHLSQMRYVANRAVFTPHPGEFLRLFGGQKLGPSEGERKKRAKEIAMRFKIVLVLKGFHTVIADPSGRMTVNPTGNPGMATGGTGDILTGIIAAFIGQGLSLYDSARFGVFFHGLAGDLAAKKIGQTSLIAGDILNYLPPAFRQILQP
ncbi:MAG: NAD(P)H-hydrate dehydratase [Candidatus Omnitrophica bacterium]|nr:NAD(P)H-hydrate dehydratase [Candidatus Omnitrophota bacterium]